MSVYFIQHGHDGPIKVGFSRTPAKRIKEIANVCPDTIAVIAVIEGPHALEQRIHRAFRAHRHRGEWLKNVPAVRDFASACKVSSGDEIAKMLDAMDDLSARRIGDLEATGQAFIALVGLALKRHTSPKNIDAFSAATGLTTRRLRAIAKAGNLTVEEFFAVSRAVPEIAELAAIICGDNLKTLEAARDALDELIKRRVQVA